MVNIIETQNLAKAFNDLMAIIVLDMSPNLKKMVGGDIISMTSPQRDERKKSLAKAKKENLVF